MEGVWVYLIALLVILLILYLWRQQRSLRTYPPGPLPLPFIGGLWRIVFRYREDTLIKLAKQYGNIYTLWVANLPVVVLSGFHAVKEGLVNHLEELSDRPLTPFFRVIGREKGVALSNGHTWKQQRRFGLHSLRKLGLGKKSMERQIEAEAQQLVEIFAREKAVDTGNVAEIGRSFFTFGKDCPSQTRYVSSAFDGFSAGQPFNPSMAITNSVSNVICAVTFGQRFSLEDENFKKLIEALDLALIAIGSFSHASKNDPDSTYDEENLAQYIQDLFITGTETTATVLKWAILLLANYPDIQDKVYKEIEDVLVSSSICYQDLKKLPYTNAVFHEIQRSKYILLVGFPRQSTKDMNLRGFHIPKGTIIIPNVRSVLLDPEQWETPEEFNPNHFLDKEGNFVAREEFLPFGAGARVCLGEQLARMEYFLFLTNLLRAFHFQLPEGVKKLNQTPIIGLTTPPHPYKVCAVPRHSP
ncbi:cytochrome P450 2K6 isoform X5 [Anolis carolinensis]|uniref:cytochrome P450 2K6 isoform X5 n=1 Tax=Anolis carolinensis TaxID=28377 RepID=UPI002F2B1C88